MNTLTKVPILGRHPLSAAIIRQEKTLENLHFKRLYLVVRQENPWKATMVMDLTSNLSAKNQDTSEDFEAYLQFKETLSEVILINKNVFAHLQSRWVSELGVQPDRLRIIYAKDQDYMDYNVRISLLEKEKIMIQIK